MSRSYFTSDGAESSKSVKPLHFYTLKDLVTAVAVSKHAQALLACAMLVSLVHVALLPDRRWGTYTYKLRIA